MKHSIIFTLLAFLVVVDYMDILCYLIGKDHWEGLRVVPIVMTVEIMVGAYFSLSFQYKPINKTIWRVYFSGIGCAVPIAINVIFVPRYGYIACVRADFAGYGVAMILSYIVRQKMYPIRYPMRSILIYVALAVTRFFVMTTFNDILTTAGALVVNILLIASFVAYIIKSDFPLRQLPIVGKYLRK